MGKVTAWVNGSLQFVEECAVEVKETVAEVVAKVEEVVAEVVETVEEVVADFKETVEELTGQDEAPLVVSEDDIAPVEVVEPVVEAPKTGKKKF